MSHNKARPSPAAAASSSSSSSSHSVNSAALQDQLIRSLDLNLNPVRSNRRRTTQPSRQPRPNAEAPAGSWTCEACTLVNPGGTSCCQACGGPFRTGGQQQPPADGEYAERPTLAQMRGLAPPPPKKLTERQWVDVEFNAMVRGDANGTCSICFNDFSSGDQVILDCSHTFHAECIRSFEKFLRAKQRTCPMCRHASYQKKVTDVGMILHRVKCATKMQGQIRGFVGRCKYRAMLKRHYAEGGDGKEVNSERRRDFYAAEIGTLGDRLAATVEEKEDSIEDLFKEFDANLAVSRHLFSEAGAGGAPPPPAAPASPPPPPPAKPALGPMEWLSVWNSTTKRSGVHECGICLCACDIPAVPAPSALAGVAPPSASSEMALLSCTHVFHQKCILSFEQFNIYEGVNLCPICRTDYKRIGVGEVLAIEYGVKYGDARYIPKDAGT
ncbi:hypothetical protein TeGR_g2084 [Tetraparma gracilis]|nr:hypothetical protein TeGR_g2084 [Tetraparma gracilis]